MPNIPAVTTNKDRVYNLTVELKEAKRAKKQANKDANEEIKRIEAEIEEVIEAEENDNGQDAPRD